MVKVCDRCNLIGSINIPTLDSTQYMVHCQGYVHVHVAYQLLRHGTLDTLGLGTAATCVESKFMRGVKRPVTYTLHRKR